MSFLDKFKQPSPGEAASGGGSSGSHDATSSRAGDAPSIISEALPTDPAPAAGDFAETGAAFASSTVAADSTLTPTTQRAKAAGQAQRQMLLTALVVLGLIGTAGTVALNLISGSRNAAQVRATGQALPRRDC